VSGKTGSDWGLEAESVIECSLVSRICLIWIEHWCDYDNVTMRYTTPHAIVMLFQLRTRATWRNPRFSNLQQCDVRHFKTLNFGRFLGQATCLLVISAAHAHTHTRTHAHTHTGLRRNSLFDARISITQHVYNYQDDGYYRLSGCIARIMYTRCVALLCFALLCFALLCCSVLMTHLDC